MKRTLALVLAFFLFFFFLGIGKIQAQGTFQCNCIPDAYGHQFGILDEGTGKNVCISSWVIGYEDCDWYNDYVSDLSLCAIKCDEMETSSIGTCVTNNPITVDCIPYTDESPVKLWGESCNQSQDQCEDGTFCRHGTCLKPQNSLSLEEQCYHQDECGPLDQDWLCSGDGTGISRCEQPATAGDQILCQRGDCVGCFGDPDDSPYLIETICDPSVPNLTCHANSVCVFEGSVEPGGGCIDDVECQGQYKCRYGFCAAERQDYPFELCKQIPDLKLRSGCCECQTGSSDLNDDLECIDAPIDFTQGIWTAIGCIRAEPEKIVEAVLEVGISVAGGVALLMFLAASFMLSTSQGDPKKTSEARELITSAVIGILFAVFSVAILQFIGYDILRIPGFGGP